MADVRIIEIKSELEGVTHDWLLTPIGTLDDTEELATAVRVALGTDRLAGPHEVLPDPDSIDRRGWWGDYQAEEIWDGWQIGCKNWLLLRAKISDQFSWESATLLRARNYTRDALQPLIDKRVASRVDVSAQRVGKSEIDVRVVIYRGPNAAISLRYQYLWEGIAPGALVPTVPGP